MFETTRRYRWLTVAALALGAMMLSSCGGGSEDAGGNDTPTTEASSGSDTADPDESADTTGEPGEGDADGGATDGGETAGGLCGTIDEAAVSEVIGEIAETSQVHAPEDGTILHYGDGRELPYFPEGCRYTAVVEGDEDGHKVTISVAPNPDGKDLYAEFESVRDPADLTAVTGVGDEAQLDSTFDSQRVQLRVKMGDRVLFVTSQPPFDTPVLTQDQLVALANAVMADL